MSVIVQHRRDTAANIAAATPAQGEFWYNDDTARIHTGDGSTAGGNPTARLSEVASVVRASGVNANSVGDTAFAINMPPGVSRYRVARVTALNPSISLTSAQAAVYTAPTAGGVAVCSPQALSGLTTSSANTAGNAIDLTLALAGATFFTAPTLYFRITTAQGSAAAVDVAIEIQPY